MVYVFIQKETKTVVSNITLSIGSQRHVNYSSMAFSVMKKKWKQKQIKQVNNNVSDLFIYGNKIVIKWFLNKSNHVNSNELNFYWTRFFTTPNQYQI